MKFQDRLTLMRRVPPELVHANDGGTAKREDVERWLDSIRDAGVRNFPPDDERFICQIVAHWDDADLTHRLAVVSHLHDVLPRSRGILPSPGISGRFDSPCILDTPPTR
ncbi:MAG: hypothetical protein HY566_02675 [Candidatus Kerfeldbacteria bacterium]|nr:hypothetical protein [Candidatus Kerfeldbacteria bacterium]